MSVKYIKDSDVDETLDSQLKALLSQCFTKPEEARFKTQRYYNEMPKHRWFIEDIEQGILVAHLAIHEKIVIEGDTAYPIGGVAEVCVHPDYRGLGYVNQLVESAHKWMKQQRFEFSMLFGSDEIYRSSGYVRVANVSLCPDYHQGSQQYTPISVMVAPLQNQRWPETAIILPSIPF
ncbi:GNAT family N-acetyltransferase [Vibrio sp. ZSDZ34]|uniref:GNAT family N-acetyltransferase n=1 Tax=Vibrio gelatinilyticus TaxID=2893468 RepID=A0A9X1W9E4_9VIBR|nr:GNAT family N-acetyltransferase [Vibrio gelatinilyticus]MCJ2376787.1 GNAT family N-acetyltransferase [Vibrio gelatinilyticus]